MRRRRPSGTWSRTTPVPCDLRSLLLLLLLLGCPSGIDDDTAEDDDAAGDDDTAADDDDDLPPLPWSDAPCDGLAGGSGSYGEIIARWAAQDAGAAPPDESLFVDDLLHLSEEGYALWTATILPALEAAVPPRPTPAPAMPAGSLVRVDLGPSNPDDGAPASVDGFGIHWNAWHPVEGGDQVLDGEALRGLVTTEGAPTGVDLVISGGFRSNGFANGGLVAPSGDLLGTLALPEATGDFFWIEGADDPGALALTGLDPAATHTLRLFTSRADDAEVRVTRYDVTGAASSSASLTTTGPDTGTDGYDGNDDTVAVLTGLQPDGWGQLHLDVVREVGQYAYLSLLEIEAEAR